MKNCWFQIDSSLDKIHTSYPRLNFTKLIPCNCVTCKGSQKPHFFKYDSLKKRISNKKYKIECEESFEKVNILVLIDDTLVTDQVDITDRKMRIEYLKNLIRGNTRRLQKLKEQQAIEGKSVGPEVLIEIEDIETEIRKLRAELKEEF